MNARRSANSIVVVCALEFECAQLRRAGLEKQFEICCCGPGAAGVEEWARRALDELSGPVILAGVAGGLVENAQVGKAFVVGEVRMQDMGVMSPNWQLQGAEVVSVSSPKDVLSTSEAKRAWHAKLGTDLIDLESEAFARAMQQAGRTWAIVRGVSDGPNDELPPEMAAWVDARGRTRASAVAVALLKNPKLAAAARRIGNNAKSAMSAVAEVLRLAVNSA